jgi:hypothetical protein
LGTRGEQFGLTDAAATLDSLRLNDPEVGPDKPKELAAARAVLVK